MFVKAGHLVVLGYGNEGGEHYIYNKAIGESNGVQDDGVNYVMVSTSLLGRLLPDSPSSRKTEKCNERRPRC